MDRDNNDDDWLGVLFSLDTSHIIGSYVVSALLPIFSWWWLPILSDSVLVLMAWWICWHTFSGLWMVRLQWLNWLKAVYTLIMIHIRIDIPCCSDSVSIYCSTNHVRDTRNRKTTWWSQMEDVNKHNTIKHNKHLVLTSNHCNTFIETRRS